MAETGSVLSHLAILAREAGVATVVGYAGAIERPARGARSTSTATTGRVTIEDEEDGAVKTIAWLAGIGTLLWRLVYMVVSLNRWEWNRALFFGLIVLIAEVGLATGLVLRKLNPPRASAPTRTTLAILRATRPRSPTASPG